MTNEEIIELIKNNLYIESDVSTETDYGDKYTNIKISISFGGENICSTTIIL